MKRLLPALVVLALLAGACGDDDGGSAPSTSPPGGDGGSTSSTSAPGGADDALEVLKLSYPGNASYTQLPVAIALDQGFDQELGLEVDRPTISSGPELTAALLSGDADMVNFTPSNIFPLIEGGEPVVVMATTVDGSLWELVVSVDHPLPAAGAGWEAVMAALEGARIGVPALGAAGQQFVEGLFTAAGMPKDSATYLATGLGPTSLPALENGEIDAIAAIEPTVTQALNEGLAVLPFSMSGGTGPAELDFASTVLMTTASKADEEPELLCRGRTLFQMGVDFLLDPANDEDTLRVMEQFLSIDRDVSVPMLERIRPLFSKTLDVDPDRLDPHFAFLHAMGAAKESHRVEDFTVDVCAR